MPVKYSSRTYILLCWIAAEPEDMPMKVNGPAVEHVRVPL